MSKRARGWTTAAGRPYKRPRQDMTVATIPRGVLMNRRRVPLGTRGYRLNRVEKKVYTLPTAVYQVNSTGVVTLLAIPALGSDMSNRIGRKIVLKSFYIRGRLSTEPAGATPQAATTAPLNFCRFIVFADLQPNGAAPAITAVLDTADPYSHLNLDNRDRFKIYCDKTFGFDPYLYNVTATTSLASASNQVVSLKKYKKINLEMIFNGTNGGTIADVNSGALYMLWIGSNGAGTGDANAVLSTRVRFLDI